MSKTGRRRVGALATVLSVVVALVVPLAGSAAAGHGTCVLDVDPETDSNDLGQQHVLTAELRPAGSNENSTATCTTRESGPVDVNFEVSTSDSATYSPGSIDPQSTTNTPDLSCRIGPSANSCTVSYARTTPAGSDAVRGWIADTTVDANETQPVDDADQTDVVAKTWTAPAPVATFLNVTPESSTNPVQTQHTLTATVRDQTGAVINGARVDFEILSGPNANLDGNAADADLECATTGNGSCTVSYTDAPTNPAAPNNVDTICGWLDNDNDSVFNLGGTLDDGGDCDQEQIGETEDSPLAGVDTFGNDATDSVTKSWGVGTPAFLNVEPESDVNTVQTAHTLTATARDAAGTLVSGARVDFEILSGPNANLDGNAADSDLECITDSSGSCTVTYTDGPNNPAAPNNVDAICGWLDTDNDSVFNPGGTDATDGGDCDLEQAGETENSPVAGNDTFGNDATDSVTKTWGGTAPTFLNVEPETSTNAPRTRHTLSVTARDQAGSVVGGVRVDFEVVSGPNANLDGNAADTDLECTTANNGTCTVNYTDGTNDPAAPNNVDTICGWLDTDNDSVFNPGGTVAADGGDCDLEQVGETEDSPLTGVDTFGNDATDAVTKTWVAPDARTIDCEPETSTGPTGTEHTVVCTVRDTAGDPLAGESVTFTESGPGTLATAAVVTTDAGGQAAVRVTSTEVGTQSITGTITDDLTGSEPGEVDECDRAANDPAGAPAGVCSDSVQRTWELPTGVPRVCAAQPSAIIGTAGDDALTGTPGDDIICTLGGNDVVDGLGGDDIIVLGAGNDLAVGRAGRDVIRGGGGGDLIAGGGGRDVLRGGAGADVLRGNARDDVLVGGRGADTVEGGRGNDTLRGNRHNDTLKGGPGDDLLNGGLGADFCRGGRGGDVLRRCEF